ncbi:GNAT family N-acetyltransferase [Bosea sp. 2RAB26]|uniref:GNAT family N-acetyltransferase n=1 Tax=Bosea sp. 2RAB26 TaxID=3237476 RepID=UPI003F8F5CA8
MPDVAVNLTDTANPDLHAVISQGLRDYNVEMGGVSDHRPLTITIKDSRSDELIGGLLGRTSLGLLFIDLFYVPKTQRGSGLGTRILQMAEAEGFRRGCRKAVLYTLSFQAPEFYKRFGWSVFGEIALEPPGATRYFMTKDLAAPADGA